MQSLQKHIINKLTVDVETQNPRTAFDLKDKIDTFLKNEILPHLDDYFSSITEELHSQTIQIPYLSVNVDTSSVLNYKELKEDVKKEIIKEIKQITSPIKALENDVVFIKRNKSKEQSIFHLLEEGTNSWWIGSEDSFYFNDEEFYELLKSKSFQSKLKQKLTRKQVQNRFISQFSNQQIHRTLQILFQSNIDFLLEETILKSIEKLPLKFRATIWEYLIDFAINNNRDSLTTKLVFEFSELIPEILQKGESKNRKESKPERKTTAFKMNSQQKLMIKTIMSILVRVHKTNKTELTSKVIHSIAENKKYYNQILGVDILELIVDAFQAKSISKKASKDISKLVEDIGNETTSNSANSSIDILSETDKNQKQLELMNPKEKDVESNLKGNKISIDYNQEEQNAKEVKSEKTHNKVEDFESLSSSKESNDKTSDENDKLEQIKFNKQKAEERKSKQDNLHESKKEFEKSRADQEEQLPLKNAEKITPESQLEDIKSKTSETLDIEVENLEKIKNEARKNEEKESIKDTISNTLEIESEDEKNRLKETLKREHNLINKKEKATSYMPKREENSKAEASTKSKQEPSLIDEEIVASAKSLKESMSNLINENDRILLHKRKMQNEEKEVLKGDYQINNAGLILLHPYLGQFFKNCNVLNENNEIINPDLAVHLLHYLATKQEQQFESNMLFEKILCGVPMKKTIYRNIELPDELKTNAEELLEAVLANWGVLKNASPDLLRNEFLQRFGKISFKDVNPKITIEKKVHDILLEKLPWNIGISRLPWLDYLLFTDW